MKKLKGFIEVSKDCGALGGWVSLLTSIFLLIGAALTPPMFIIDSSIIAAVGELFAFGALFKAPQMINSIREGKSLKVQKGDTTIEVNSQATESGNE